CRQSRAGCPADADCVGQFVVHHRHPLLLGVRPGFGDPQCWVHDFTSKSAAAGMAAVPQAKQETGQLARGMGCWAFGVTMLGRAAWQRLEQAQRIARASRLAMRGAAGWRPRERTGCNLPGTMPAIAAASGCGGAPTAKT